MYPPTRLAGYAVLLVTPAALLARALVSTGVSPPVAGLEVGVVLAGGVAVVAEHEQALVAPDGLELDRGDAADALAVVAAAIVTYLLSVHAGLGPVVASALVGLVAGVLADDIAVAAYCGSFVGMASPTLFPSVGYLAVAGLVSGVAFVAAERAFSGFGGKLGTLALFGCATTAVLTDATYAGGSALSPAVALLVVPISVAGAVGAVVLSVRLELGAVVGSAVVGLVAGVGLPALAGLATGLAVPQISALPGETLAAAAFCASFVGMSSAERLDGEARVGLAGAVCGLVFVAVAAVFAGAGGKLGTTAFVACVTTAGAERLFTALPSALDN